MSLGLNDRIYPRQALPTIREPSGLHWYTPLTESIWFGHSNPSGQKGLELKSVHYFQPFVLKPVLGSDEH